MSVNKTSDSTKSAIIRKSVKSLPNNPSREGYTATDIKKAMYDFVTGDTYSVMAEMDRIVDETNENFTEKSQDLTAHINDHTNPHAITKSQVGLGNVDNTSDSNKPVSAPQQQALNNKVSYADIVDNLETSDANKPLSSKQGKILKGSVDTLSAEVSEKVSTNDFLGHKNNTNNPHNVTKAQIGLGNVNNTSDMDKPVSTSQQAALDSKVNISDIIDDLTSAVADKPLSAKQGKSLKAAITALEEADRNFASIEQLNAHKNNTNNPHGITKSQLGLNNVDNTSDANKPISTLTQQALNTKINISDIKNDLTSLDTNKPLSAKQGNELKAGLDAVSASLSQKAGMQDVILKNTRGMPNGVAELDDSGKVPTNQLPMSDIAPIVELIDFTNTEPVVADAGAIYYNSNTKRLYTSNGTIWTDETIPVSTKIYSVIAGENANKQYRWGGTSLVLMSSNLVLGETSSNAYRGDRGKTAYDHAQLTSGNPHHVTKNDIGLGNVNNTADSVKDVRSAGKLTTPTTINGASFDGSSAITIYDNTKAIKASNLTGATKTKITYNSEGIVTGGSDLADSDIPDTIARESEISELTAAIQNKLNKTLSTGNKMLVTDASGNITTADKPTPTTVVDNLTSSSSTSALSAKQGKVLNGLIGDLSSAVGEKADSSDVVFSSEKGANGGVAELDSSGKLKSTQIPSTVPYATSAGTSSTASTLATARKINGINFDGSSDITIYDSTKIPQLASPLDISSPKAKVSYDAYGRVTGSAALQDADIPNSISRAADVTEALSNKLNNNLGVSSANKMLVVDNNGDITTQDQPTGITVVDNLTTQSSSQSLSAKQGYILNTNKANDSVVVHKSGNESIDGTKNFIGNLQQNGKPIVSFEETSEATITPNTNAILKDKNNNTIYPFTDSANVIGLDNLLVNKAANDLSNVTYPTLTADGVERTGSGDRVIKSKISSDGKSWYRVWASGWKECGMVGQYKSTWALLVFALPITFSNTNYVITFGRTTNNYTGYAGLMCNGYSNKTTSGFSTYADSGYPLEVYCCGY